MRSEQICRARLSWLPVSQLSANAHNQTARQQQLADQLTACSAGAFWLPHCKVKHSAKRFARFALLLQITVVMKLSLVEMITEQQRHAMIQEFKPVFSWWWWSMVMMMVAWQSGGDWRIKVILICPCIACTTPLLPWMFYKIQIRDWKFGGSGNSFHSTS